VPSVVALEVLLGSVVAPVVLLDSVVGAEVGCCVLGDELGVLLVVESSTCVAAGVWFELVVAVEGWLMVAVVTTGELDSVDSVGVLLSASANTRTGCTPINNNTITLDSIFTFNRVSIVINRLYCILSCPPVIDLGNGTNAVRSRLESSCPEWARLSSAAQVQCTRRIN
jgi:hypothetical protein